MSSSSSRGSHDRHDDRKRKRGDDPHKKERSRSPPRRIERKEEREHRGKGRDQERDHKDKHRKHKHKKEHKKKHKAKDKKTKRKKDKEPNKREAKAFLAKAGVSLLERKDFFTKNPEFSVWIKETLNVCFDDLEKTTSIALFDDFIRIWNEGRLSEKFYRGIPPSELDPSTRTTYRWGFAKKIDESEALTLGTMRDEIAAATHNPKRSGLPAKPPAASLAVSRPTNTANEPTEGMDEEDRRRYERLAQKQKDRQFESRRAAALDELVPRADPGSRERRLEKRKEKGGRKGDSDDDGAGTTDVMGDGDNFQARIRQERERRTRREDAKREIREKKLSEWQQKETERMAAFKQMMIAQGCNYLTEAPTPASEPAPLHTRPQIGPARPT